MKELPATPDDIRRVVETTSGAMAVNHADLVAALRQGLGEHCFFCGVLFVPLCTFAVCVLSPSSDLSKVDCLPCFPESLMNLLCAIGSAYCALWMYDCIKALKLFDQLPPHHFSTSWVLRHVARAHFESAQYMKAAKVFDEIRSDDPHLHEGRALFNKWMDKQTDRQTDRQTDLV